MRNSDFENSMLKSSVRSQADQSFPMPIKHSNFLDSKNGNFGEGVTAKETVKDFRDLKFQYVETKSHIRYFYRNGKWENGKLEESPYMPMHIAATALHYGQSAFEGLKAFKDVQGGVRIFRPRANCHRMKSSAARLMMPEVPEEIFLEACEKVVQDNIEYIPPYETGGALYLRPILFGTGARIGVRPADEYCFAVMAVPVGEYYSKMDKVRAIVMDEYDRAAPNGMGAVKAAGNYASSIYPSHLAAEKGFSINLFLDAKEHKYIDEFGTANFVAIDNEGVYITPDSKTVLPSITNDSLLKLAPTLGVEVKRRPIEYTEIKDLLEVAACGTAVVMTPVHEICRGEETISIKHQIGLGKTLSLLKSELVKIQKGERDDPFSWCYPVR